MHFNPAIDRKSSKAAPRGNPFLTDIEEIRQRARYDIERGTAAANYEGKPKTVVGLLNEALATELLCILRYKRHHYLAKGIHSKSVAAALLAHAVEEQVHAGQIAERIVQLDGEPNFSPEGMLAHYRSKYKEGETLLDMLREDLIAEQIAIESYGEIIRCLGDSDLISRRMLEEILANEEEHAEDMKSLLARVSHGEKSGGTKPVRQRPLRKASSCMHCVA